MPSPLLSSVKDIVQQGRDYTQLVRQVKDILPQFSDDQVCDALVQSDEDIARAVDLLMSQQPMTTKSKKKKGKEKDKARERNERDEKEGGEEKEREACEAEEDKEVRDERPKTRNEKEAAKLRKKLREIERIEEKLAQGEKVDPLQLPKLEKKTDTKDQLRILEQKIEEERRWQEMQQQEEQAQKEKAQVMQEVQAAEAYPSYASWQYEAPQAAYTHETVAPQYAAPVEQPRFQSDPPESKHENMRAELLNMLDKTLPESGQYEHSKQLANQLSAGGRSTLHQMGAQSEGWVCNNYDNSRYQYTTQYSQNWKAKQWREDGYWKEQSKVQEARGNAEVKGDWANFYSTPLDVSSIPADKRAEAERIAKEIENSDGWNDTKGYRNGNAKGKGKGKKGKGRDGGGKGKSRDWKEWKDSREWKEPRDWPKADWGPPGL